MGEKRTKNGGGTTMLTEEKTQEYTLDGVMIGKRIKSARKEKKYTQEELAARCHCTATHISNVENGKIGISLELLYILGIVLEKSLDYFIMDSNGVNPQIKIGMNISPKLERCDRKMLAIVDNVLDELLTYQESVADEITELKKKHNIEDE